MFQTPVLTLLSPSKTYMLGTYTLTNPNDIRVGEVVLPPSVPNTIKNAKFYYLLANVDEATQIRFIFCVSVEEYLNAVDRAFLKAEKERSNPNYNIFTKTLAISIEDANAIFRTTNEERKDDAKLVLKMLWDWNAKQSIPSKSYIEAMTALLKRAALMDDLDREIEKLKTE